MGMKIMTVVVVVVPFLLSHPEGVIKIAGVKC